MDKHGKKWLSAAFIGGLILILFTRLLDNWLLPTVKAGLKAIGPFVLGFVIAYLLRFAVNPLERLLKSITKAKPDARWARTLAIALTVTAFAGIIVALCLIVFPQLYQNVLRLIEALPDYLESIYSFAKQTADRFNITLPESFNDALESIKSSVADLIASNSSDIMDYAGNLIASVAGGVLNGFIALVVAIYLLADSKRYKHLTKRALKCILPSKKSYGELMRFIRTSDIIMGRYVSGKLLQTLILTAAACIGFAIIGLDYFLLLGVLAGILNLVPYIGPWIAAIPAIILALLQSPTSALLTVAVLVALQLLDNLLLGPYILGEKLKVSPLWIFVGIIIGGAMFGLAGMLLGAPAVAILNTLIEKFIELREKSIKKDAKEA